MLRLRGGGWQLPISNRSSVAQHGHPSVTRLAPRTAPDFLGVSTSLAVAYVLGEMPGVIHVMIG